MELRRKRRALLALEELEMRWVPSLTVQSFNGTLYVSGLPVGASPPGVVITETAPNSVQVMDGSHNLGTYAHISNVNLNLTNHQNKSVNINLNGNTLSGNLFINEGTGDTTGNAANGTGIFGGRIGGSLTVVGGSGDEEVIPGFEVISTVPFAVPMGLSVGGDIVFNAHPGQAPSVTNVLDTGILLGAAAPTVTVGGSIRTTFVDLVGIGQNTTVGKGLTYTAARGAGDGFLGIAGTIRGSVQATFGNGAAGNTLDLMPTGSIVGSLQASMGAGSDTVMLEAGSTIGTSANISSGTGNDFFDIAGQILGSASFNAGDGSDSITLETSASVLGNLTLTGGSGNDSVTMSAAVLGNLIMQLGNGNDTVLVNPTVAPTGLFTLNAGNGNSSVSLAPGSATAFHIAFNFGTGTDTLNLAGTTSTISGSLLSQNPGGNVFNQGTWTIVPPWTSNF